MIINNSKNNKKAMLAIVTLTAGLMMNFSSHAFDLYAETDTAADTAVIHEDNSKDVKLPSKANKDSGPLKSISEKIHNLHEKRKKIREERIAKRKKNKQQLKKVEQKQKGNYKHLNK